MACESKKGLVIPWVKAKADLLHILLKLFLVLSFEKRKGRISGDEIPDFLASYTHVYLDDSEDPVFAEQQKRYAALRERYTSISTFSLGLGVEAWVEVIGLSKISTDTIHASLRQSKYFQTTREPTVEKLFGYKFLTDEVFESLS